MFHGEVEDIPHPPPSPAASGPNGTGVNNSLGKLDKPKHLLESSKSHKSELKAREITQYGLINQVCNPRADNDEKEKD